MKRLARLNRSDTRRIKKALASMHKALDGLERVLAPRFMLEESISTEQIPPKETSDTEIIRVFTDILSAFRTMIMMVDYTENFRSLMVQLHYTPATLEPPRRVAFTPKHPSPVQVNWIKARGVLSLREYSILEYRLGIRNEPRTLAEVGQDFHITRERVRQIQKVAVSKLEDAGLLVRQDYPRVGVARAVELLIRQ